METITFQRGKPITDSLDIGEFRALADDMQKLFSHPAVYDARLALGNLTRDSSDGYGITEFKYLCFSVDMSKVEEYRPDKFLIKYLPVKYFDHVIADPYFVKGGSSVHLEEIYKLPKSFRMSMYIREEYSDKFVKICKDIKEIY